ncbi:CbiX/SirB N-terminal domain-containing protein [Haloplanus halobius]|uniref:CbiX/SirB N-terminal domain-containing protein n=1 Tax=Haloplanus halobius TaxID=2934938 RepID=UPI00200D41FC|nr:CbiX/SirB N-terminal domain-containing protein [Haloplanus sp. XH21]
MTRETVLLVGRRAENTEDVLETHARRLRERGVADAVRTATYEHEPIRELRESLSALSADRVYALPMCLAHSYETTEDIPAALSYVPGTVHYGEPVGRSPAVTGVVEQRAAAQVPPAASASLVLIGFGNSSQPYHRQAVEYHADRLRERTAYGEVRTCFLLQNPAVECVRYNVTGDRTVAVPLFVTRSDATEREIPAKLELDRGGIEYADPLGTHAHVTDALEAEVARQRVLATADDGTPTTFESTLTQSRTPLATDGEGLDD